MSQSSSGGSSSGGSSGSSRSTTPTTRPRPRTTDPFRGPIFVTGQVMTELNRPVPEPVSVEMQCGMRTIQLIHTDMKGYFSFNLGSRGMQTNTDFSASNSSPTSLSSAMNTPIGRSRNSLSGCEVRIAVAGYHPINQPLTQLNGMGRYDMGTIRLTRIANGAGSGISVTSLLVPDDARKEYENALKDIEKNKQESALDHLEKAVGIYDKFAAAWNEIGKIHDAGEDAAKAEEAFSQAVAADPKYIPPILGLASLHLRAGDWQAALEAGEQAAALDADIPFANFVLAISNFNLSKFEASEKSALTLEKSAHESFPQVHALLAELSLQHEEYPEAADHMRKYLEEAPEGAFAEQMKDTLGQMEDEGVIAAKR